MNVKVGESCPKCGSTMEWMPLDCEHGWHKRIKVSTVFKIHESFDAREWAAYFMAVLRENPDIVIDDELMTTWFANALMRGYDEYYWRSEKYKRSVRRVLVPWWKRWFVSLDNYGH